MTGKLNEAETKVFVMILPLETFLFFSYSCAYYHCYVYMAIILLQTAAVVKGRRRCPPLSVGGFSSEKDYYNDRTNVFDVPSRLYHCNYDNYPNSTGYV